MNARLATVPNLSWISLIILCASSYAHPLTNPISTWRNFTFECILYMDPLPPIIGRIYVLLNMPLPLPLTWRNAYYDGSVWNMNSSGCIQRWCYPLVFLLDHIWKSEVSGGDGLDAGILPMKYIYCTYSAALYSTLCMVMGRNTPWCFQYRWWEFWGVVTFISSNPQNHVTN